MADRAHKFRFDSTVNPDIRCSAGMRVGRHVGGSFRSIHSSPSPFYQKVAKPLLSMGTVGSMDCERRAKPLKHTIVTSKRNRLKDETGAALLRGYENLNHLMNAKKLVGKQVHESLLRR
eukprot:scaffold37707_cov119-Skeletonema_marinoi.AAC.1